MLQKILTSRYSKQKHQCPNRSNNNKKQASHTNSTSTIITNNPAANNNNISKPNYYDNKKSHYGSQLSKPKMANSFELLTDSIAEIQRKYEILSDIVSGYNGEVHGSQSHIIANNSMSLIVYYEVPQGKREEVKEKFANFVTRN